MMKQLEEIANQFGVSKATFVATVDSDGSRIEFVVKDKYSPQKQMFVDPIAKLMVGHYQETLDSTKKRFVNKTYLPGVHSDIVRATAEFYLDHAPLKNPKQSKLYKWLNTMHNRYNHPASEGFIALFRYYHSGDTTDLMTQNILAILELMKEKYETSD